MDTTDIDIDRLCLGEDWRNTYQDLLAGKTQMAAYKGMKKDTQYDRILRLHKAAEKKEVSLRNACVVSALERVLESGDHQDSPIVSKLKRIFNSDYGMLGSTNNNRVYGYFTLGFEGEMSYLTDFEQEQLSVQEQLLVKSSPWNNDVFKYIRELNRARDKKKGGSQLYNCRCKVLYAMAESLVNVAEDLLDANGHEDEIRRRMKSRRDNSMRHRKLLLPPNVPR